MSKPNVMTWKKDIDSQVDSYGITRQFVVIKGINVEFPQALVDYVSQLIAQAEQKARADERKTILGAWKDHNTAEFVRDLIQIANEYAYSQQLKRRIKERVFQAIKGIRGGNSRWKQS